MATADIETKQKIEINNKIQPPKMYKVIYLNDEVTTVEFVIQTLLEIFDFSEEAAADITLKIHQDGSAIVAVLPYEIAEQKGIEVTVLARNNGFPLQVRIEPEA